MAEEPSLPFEIPSLVSSLLPEIPKLTSLLPCSICYDLQDHSTSTPCHHSFCSFCIRRYLQYKTQCPTCHSTVYEQNLVPIKTFDSCVMLMKPLVERAVKLLNQSTFENASDVQKENVEPKDAVKDVTTVKSEPLPLSPVKSGCNNILSNNIQSTVKVEVDLSKHELLDRTPCIVCKVPIPNRSVEMHVEKCLIMKKVPPPPVPVIKKRPTIPKLVYALLKDNDLKRKCREFGLNPKGERKSLINRLQKYTLLYNTEIQMENPRSKMEIVMQVKLSMKEIVWK